MPNKVTLTDQQILINRFAFILLKHFSGTKIKVQDTVIKIPVEQLCGQDFYFLTRLNDSTGDVLGLNVSRSGKGLVILLGVAQLTEIPLFLKEYKR